MAIKDVRLFLDRRTLVNGTDQPISLQGYINLLEWLKEAVLYVESIAPITGVSYEPTTNTLSIETTAGTITGTMDIQNSLLTNIVIVDGTQYDTDNTIDEVLQALSNLTRIMDANNGLTNNGQIAQLGGSLLQSTNIDGDAYDFSITNASALEFTGKTLTATTSLYIVINSDGSFLDVRTGGVDTLYCSAASKVGVRTIDPQVAFEVDSWNAGESGIRMTQITNATASTLGSAPLGINATGDIVIYNENAFAFKTSSYSVLTSDKTIVASSGTFSLFLPVASTCQGKIYHFKNSGAGVITIDPASAELIDGLSTKTIAAGVAYTIVSNGIGWITLH